MVYRASKPQQTTLMRLIWGNHHDLHSKNKEDGASFVRFDEGPAGRADPLHP